MRLFAAIVPPRAVLDEVRGLVLGVRAGDQDDRRGIRGRLGRRSAESERPSDELDVPDLEQMYLPLTSFGNVALGDSVQLANALRADAAGWSRPTLHMAGGAALEFPGDESVWVKLDGDLDELTAIGRGVPQVVKRLGFFVDRRQFRPWLSVGTITDTTTAPYLQRVVDALDAYRGQPWTVESISLMKRLPEEGPDAFEEMEQMPLSAR